MKAMNKYDYSQINKLLNPNGVVFFGSNFFNTIPVYELAKSLGIEENVYNRSIDSLNIITAIDSLNACVFELSPNKIFINIGENDITKKNFDIDDFIQKYEWMLYVIARKTNAKIFVTSIVSDLDVVNQVNLKLKALSVEHGCKFVDLSYLVNKDDANIKAFELMKIYIRNHPLTFDEIMSAF